MRKLLGPLSRDLFSHKNSILDVWVGSEYASDFEQGSPAAMLMISMMN